MPPRVSSWTVESLADWLTITDGTSGTGGTVTYTVSRNSSAEEREGQIKVSSLGESGEWELSVLEEGGAFDPESIFLSYAPDGQPAVAYQDSGNNRLRFASYDGSTWQRETVDWRMAVYTITWIMGPMAGR